MIRIRQQHCSLARIVRLGREKVLLEKWGIQYFLAIFARIWKYRIENLSITFQIMEGGKRKRERCLYFLSGDLNFKPAEYVFLWDWGIKVQGFFSPERRKRIDYKPKIPVPDKERAAMVSGPSLFSWGWRHTFEFKSGRAKSWYCPPPPPPCRLVCTNSTCAWGRRAG